MWDLIVVDDESFPVVRVIGTHRAFRMARELARMTNSLVRAVRIGSTAR